MSSDDVPEELEEHCTRCHVALAGIEQQLQPVMAVSRTQMEEKLESLDAASEILLLTYTMNSLFWVYLATHGVDPKSHPIKRELERVQKAMRRAKAVSNQRKKAGVRLNTDAAKRFVRNALWEADHQQQQQQSESGEDRSGKDHTTDDPDGNQASGSRKRKLDETSNSDSVKRTRV